MRNRIIVSIVSYISLLAGVIQFFARPGTPFSTVTTAYDWNSRTWYLSLTLQSDKQDKVSYLLISCTFFFRPPVCSCNSLMSAISRSIFSFHSSQRALIDLGRQILSYSKDGYIYSGSDDFPRRMPLTPHRRR